MHFILVVFSLAMGECVCVNVHKHRLVLEEEDPTHIHPQMVLYFYSFRQISRHLGMPSPPPPPTPKYKQYLVCYVWHCCNGMCGGYLWVKWGEFLHDACMCVGLLTTCTNMCICVAVVHGTRLLIKDTLTQKFGMRNLALSFTICCEVAI